MAFEAEGRARGVLRTLDPQVEHLEASVGLKQKASGPKSHCVAFDLRQESQQAEVEKLSKELEVRFIPISRPRARLSCYQALEEGRRSRGRGLVSDLRGAVSLGDAKKKLEEERREIMEAGRALPKGGLGFLRL